MSEGVYVITLHSTAGAISQSVVMPRANFTQVFDVPVTCDLRGFDVRYIPPEEDDDAA